MNNIETFWATTLNSYYVIKYYYTIIRSLYFKDIKTFYLDIPIRGISK